MKQIVGFFFSVLSAVMMLSSSHALGGEDTVVCKAELSTSAGTPPIFADLVMTHEDDSNQYLDAQIGNVQFEIQSSKLDFYFKPYIRTQDGQELSGNGHFGQDDEIVLDWSSHLASGGTQTADLRCCSNCTFSDWPKSLVRPHKNSSP